MTADAGGPEGRYELVRQDRFPEDRRIKRDGARRFQFNVELECIEHRKQYPSVDVAGTIFDPRDELAGGACLRSELALGDASAAPSLTDDWADVFEGADEHWSALVETFGLHHELGGVWAGDGDGAPPSAEGDPIPIRNGVGEFGCADDVDVRLSADHRRDD